MVFDSYKNRMRGDKLLDSGSYYFVVVVGT